MLRLARRGAVCLGTNNRFFFKATAFTTSIEGSTRSVGVHGERIMRVVLQLVTFFPLNDGTLPGRCSETRRGAPLRWPGRSILRLHEGLGRGALPQNFSRGYDLVADALRGSTSGPTRLGVFRN